MLRAPLPVPLGGADVSVVSGFPASQSSLVALVRGGISCVSERVPAVSERGQDRRVASLTRGLCFPPRQLGFPGVQIELALARIPLHSTSR